MPLKRTGSYTVPPLHSWCRSDRCSAAHRQLQPLCGYWGEQQIGACVLEGGGGYLGAAVGGGKGVDAQGWDIGRRRWEGDVQVEGAVDAA